MTAQRPLFIPLKREYFERFRNGTKAVEFRPYGPAWNERTCRIGRPVTLSLGYGKHHRLSGIVTSFRTDTRHDTIPGWADCYGPSDKRTVACIGVTLLFQGSSDPLPENLPSLCL